MERLEESRKLERAIQWNLRVHKVDVRKMMNEDIMTEEAVIDGYNRSLERISVEEVELLLSLIDQYKEKAEKQTKISSDAIFENTLLQLKLDQAYQTIEAYRDLEKG